jgi:small-conductance mechanosensitive channel
MLADYIQKSKDFFSQSIISFNNFDFKYINILNAVITIIVFRLLLLFIRKYILGKYFKNHKVDPGTQYAIIQVVTYFITIIAILFVLQALGLKVTILLAGSAALLVGIGLGLQQVFNDLICGIILLIEGSVRVDDVIETEGFIGKVEKIGLRTSIVNTLDNISIIVPNSKITSENVINWSHNIPIRRFSVSVGVAYGSDVDLVIKTLEDAVKNHPKISKDYPINVRFDDFGESSLNFKVLFWTSDLMLIEAIKSDVRYNIDKLFREKGVTIPFPQRDVHFIKKDI